MALTYPLSAPDFWNLLPVTSASFTLMDVRQHTRTRGGEILDADMGTRLWSGSVTLRDGLRVTEAADLLAIIDFAAMPGGAFQAYEMPKVRPAYDPTGSILSGFSPTIFTLATNGRELRLTGLPAGYTLRRGDMLSFAYGPGDSLRALHRVLVGAVAGGGGTTPDIEVVADIRPGASVGAAVTLIRPSCRAKIVPGSIQTGTIGPRFRSGIAFDFVQTLT